MPARFLGAWFEKFGVNCTMVFESIIEDKERLAEICEILDFQNMQTFRMFIKAEYDTESGYKLIDAASLTI